MELVKDVKDIKDAEIISESPPETPQPETPAEPAPFTMTIVMQSNGSVNLTAPFQNKILCYGLLEIARDIVRDYQNAAVAEPEKTQ